MHVIRAWCRRGYAQAAWRGNLQVRGHELNGMDSVMTAHPTLVRATRPAHSVMVRITHWVGAAAMITMILSGWAIYNASPILPS